MVRALRRSRALASLLVVSLPQASAQPVLARLARSGAPVLAGRTVPVSAGAAFSSARRRPFFSGSARPGGVPSAAFSGRVCLACALQPSAALGPLAALASSRIVRVHGGAEFFGPAHDIDAETWAETGTPPAAPSTREERNRANLSTRLAELRREFAARRPEQIRPDDFTPQSLHDLQASRTEDAQSDTAAKPIPKPAQPQESSNARSIKWLLMGQLVAQVGIEILGLAMPLLMRERFGGFSALANIAVISSLAGIVGRLLSERVAKKFGVKATYIGATALRLLSISAMVVFLLGPAAPVIASIGPLASFAGFLAQYSAQTVLTVFYSFNGLMSGMAITAEKSMAPLLLGNDRATMERFASLQQWLLETVGVGGPKLGGALVQTLSFTGAIAVYPAMLLVAVIMYGVGIRLPKDGSAPERKSLLARLRAPFGRILALLAPLKRAISAPLRSLWGRVTAPLGLIVGGAFKKAMARVTAIMDRLVMRLYLGKWIQQMGGWGQLSDADEQKLLSRSTMVWTMAGLLSMSAFLTMLMPVAAPTYAAMVAFGVANVIASHKLYSLILSRTKAKAEAVKINAAAGAAYAGVFTVALNVVGMLFDKTAGVTPFLVFNAALVAPIAVAVFFVRKKLIGLEAEGSPEPVNRPTNGFRLLFEDPVMRWAFLAYVLLGLSNPLLYQILSQAFGLWLVGGSAAAASGIASWITALYSLGGLVGALYMWRESTLISQAKKR